MRHFHVGFSSVILLTFKCEMWVYELLIQYCKLHSRHFQMRFLEWNYTNEISITISLKFVANGPINNIPPLVKIVWHRPGDKPLSEPILVSLLMHLCVTRPQWVNIALILCIYAVCTTQKISLDNSSMDMNIYYISHGQRQKPNRLFGHSIMLDLATWWTNKDIFILTPCCDI